MNTSRRFGRQHAEGAPAQVSVLVVDDNASKRLAIQAVLAPLGYCVVEADSGEAALRCVMDQDFAVILLDVCMPLMDGFETAALIRLRRQSEMTPIIFITAFASDEIQHADRYAEGAVDFMLAPVPPDELRAKVSVFANLFIKAQLLAARAREVQASADQLQLLTDAAPIGIFQTDAENRYVYTNPRWSEVTGISAEDATGRPWDTIIDATQRAELGAEMGREASDRTELSHRFELTPSGMAPRVVLVTSKSIPDGDGGTAGWVGTLADVTAEAGAEAAVAEARDVATEASRLKSDFLANMSHEIRTPMNGVIGMTDLLLETNLDPKQRDYAQTVRNSGEALMAIIGDILDFSKVEAGKLEIESIEFSVRTIVEDIVDLLAVPAQAKGLELVALVSREVPAAVRGDPGRVRQVLTNLIGNAVKFTEAGEVVLRVTAGEDAEVGVVLRFEVTDTGDGIEAEKLQLVFQPFVQADTSTSRKYGGTGLGLAISGQLVALMNGECGVSSRIGEGSTFWFTICVGVATARGMPSLSSPDPDLLGVAVLVVDDGGAQREVLCEHLANWGMSVRTADSAPAALAALRTAAMDGQAFAVALVDLSMTGMDGSSLVNAIVDDPGVMASAVVMTGLRQSAGPETEVPGVSASLSKPVHLDDLHKCMLMAVGPVVDADEPVFEPVVALSRSVDSEIGVGRLLLAEDNAINQKVAVDMLSSAGYLVDTVPDGAAAVRAAAAFSYDAILMDCQMPGLNGYEATAAIRLHEAAGRHTPIIALTAGARQEDRQRCLAAGMDHYLSKPVSKDLLLALVADSVMNGPALSELVDQFVQETEPRLAELRSALDAGDAASVGAIAQSIRTSGGQLGGRRLALSCSRLERKAASGCLPDGPTELREVEFDYEELCRTMTQHLSAQPNKLG
ncbi:MAG TPA: response regulator [Acidimicrobiales bacterium]|nr:response regulator [Acidimicrobiales bacterium]